MAYGPPEIHENPLGCLGSRRVHAGRKPGGRPEGPPHKRNASLRARVEPHLMFRITLLSLALAVALGAEPSIHLVHISGASATLSLGTHAGQPYDANTVTKDVRTLWATGRFEDIRVETTDVPEGKDIVFHVVEK